MSSYPLHQHIYRDITLFPCLDNGSSHRDGGFGITLQSSHEVSLPSSSYVSDDDVDGFTSHLLVTCLLTFC
ncbi:hypothetical protein C0J52_04854 [Blattella germanica]|nr:hypothetical protein C0J52_04854 [Blattella germanica]